jgi:carbonic anhydrase/acetyltransferase-like protein (isoleucine patch superfamily)
LIHSYQGRHPQIAPSAFVEDSAQVIGDVVIGEHSSIWFNTVVRGDVNYIRIGNRTNIQDGCVLHVQKDTHPLIIGDSVTVGHGAVVHGCTIESRCLIGMGVVLLNGVKVGSGSIIASGAVISEGTIIPPKSLFIGVPAKFLRSLIEKDLETIEAYATRYVSYKETYLRARLEQEGKAK